MTDIFQKPPPTRSPTRALDNGAEQLTYAELAEAGTALAAELNAVGIGRGDRVGVRIKSGTPDRYVAIMGVLLRPT